MRLNEGSASTRSPRCTDSECGKLLILYSLKKLSAEDQTAFEAHLLECERCFEDLTALDRTAYLLKDYLDAPPADLPFAPDLLRKRRRRWAAALAVILLLAAGAWFLRPLVAPWEPAFPRAEPTPALAADLDDLPRELQALLFTARSLMLGKDPDEGRKLLSLAEEKAPPQSDVHFRLLRERANLEYRAGAARAALEILSQAIALAERVQNPRQIARNRVVLSRLQFARFLDEEAGEEAFNGAKAAADRDGSRESAYLVLKADCERALLVSGDYMAALSIAESTLKLWPAEEPPPEALLLLARVHEALAVAGSDSAGNLAKARNLADRSLSLAAAEKNERAISDALAAEGRLRLIGGDLDGARETLTRALGVFGELDLRTEALNARANLALCYLRKNRLADAEKYLEPVLRAADRAGSPFLRFDALRLKARWLLAKGRREEARSLLEEAMETGKRLYATWIRQHDATSVRRLLSNPDAPPELPGALATGLY